MNGRFCDLHLHTKWSDGTLSVAATARRAREAGLVAIAITDHDTVGPELVAPRQEVEGLEVICGVEIKALVAGQRGEILGYFIRPGHPALQGLFSWMQEARRERMREMVRRCQERLGLPLSYEEVAARARGSVGRPHLAAELVRLGAVATPKEAFERFLGQDGECYVPLPRAESRRVIEAIRAAGGVAVLAHPGMLPLAEPEAALRALRDEGLEGVEGVYPYEPGTYRLAVDQGRLRRLAEELGLVITGGSDDHGPSSPRETLGQVRLPYEVVEELAARSEVT